VPLITYHPSYTGRTRIDQAFALRHLQPNVVLEAIDSDVIKTYVKLGMGVGIVAEMAMQGDNQTPDLVARPAAQLFGHNLARVAFKRGTYLRHFVLRFAELLSELLSRDMILRVMAGEADAYDI
jgi:LysR family cys regulon transcriptional activator